MAIVCGQFEISRQSHYQKQQREMDRQIEDEIVLEMVRQVKRKHPNMGVRKILYKIQPLLATEGLKIGRDRLFGLLRGEDLLVKRRKIYRKTTIPGLLRTPNLLPGLTISYPNQVWVCDITYLELEDGHFVYLFVIMDLFTRYILGWHVSFSLATDGALASLEMALTDHPQLPTGLIHHSDHGVQYTSHAYMDTLWEHHIRPSMGAVGNCYDNIFAERVIGILKGEYHLDARFVSIDDVTQAVQEAIFLYNTDRPHLSLNFEVPEQVYLGCYRNIPALVIPKASL